MNKTRAVTVSVFILLVLGFFILGDFRGKPEKPKEEQTSGTAGHPDFSIEAYLNSARQSLDEQMQTALDKLESDLKNTESAEGKAGICRELMAFYDMAGRPDAAAYYAVQQAEYAKSQESRITAGDYVTLINEDPRTDTSFLHYIFPYGLTAYQEALAADTGSEELKVKTARLMMDGGVDIMAGVKMLLAVLRKNDNNADAHLILGRYDIMNGELKKSIDHLNKVISLRPADAEAWLYLAQAYENAGELAKAIECLEKTKTLINDKAFIEDLDKHIEELRKQ